MNKEIEYGKWYPCKKGTMPEDILGYSTLGDMSMTAEVLVSYHGDIMSRQGGMYHSSYASNSRYKRKGGKKWNWFVKCKSLVWMAIPPQPKGIGEECKSVEEILQNYEIDE